MVPEKGDKKDTSHATSPNPNTKSPAQMTQDDLVDDPLLETDDQTLEELLADLGSDEQWLEEVAAEFSRSKEEEHRKVTVLLDEIGEGSTEDTKDERTDSHVAGGDEEEEDSSDDSDGEVMKKESKDALTQALDEVEWEKANLPPGKPPTMPPSGLESDKTDSEPVSDALGLPGVPSGLQDQLDLPELSQQDAEFEADISSRLAALKGLGGSDPALPSAPTSSVDELGLPGVPTFAPEDRPLKGVYKRQGYTDDDEKTWCTVCLEDGAIRCFGCDDDVYCARCWKEMHVGPSAGYEERGHQWETFVRSRR